MMVRRSGLRRHRRGRAQTLEGWGRAQTLEGWGRVQTLEDWLLCTVDLEQHSYLEGVSFDQL